MSNLNDINLKDRNNQEPPTKGKSKKKDKVVLIYEAQHQKLREESFKTGSEMRDIASRAIDFYFENREK